MTDDEALELAKDIVQAVKKLPDNQQDKFKAFAYQLRWASEQLSEAQMDALLDEQQLFMDKHKGLC